LVDCWMLDIVELRCDWKLIRGNRMSTCFRVWEIRVVDVVGLMGVWIAVDMVYVEKLYN